MTAVSSGRASVLILVLVFIAVLGFTNPLGDFPLNDDWSYGQAVQDLVQRHEFRLSGWTSMPLLTQVLWGALFSLPAGFSFTALRLSTLFLSMAALLLLMGLVWRKDERLLTALLGPLLLLFNPVYLNLSHTFMTDVPFIAFVLGSILLFVQGDERRNRVLLALGVCLAVLATLLRQTGVLLPVAFGIGYLIRGRAGVRKALPTAGFILLTIATYVAYTGWLSSTGRLPTGYFAQWTQIRSVLAAGPSGVGGQVARSLLSTYIYLGIFTLPFGLLFLQHAPKKRLFLLFLTSTVLLGAAQLLRVTLPGNILSDRGVGPFTLAHTAAFAVFSGGVAARILLGLLALLGGTLLLEMVVRSMESANSSLTGAVCLSLAGLCFASLSLVSQLDRYMVLYLPLLLASASMALRERPPTRPTLAASLAATLAYAVFSVSAVHDYMTWNRARWEAIRHVTDELGVPADRIDGGFEFNGLHTYSDDYVRTPDRSPWWVIDDEYVIAFDVLPGYGILTDYPVKSWLPAGIRHIFVLKRSSTSRQPQSAASTVRPLT